MSLSEILGSSHRFTEQVKGVAAKVSHNSFQMETLAETGTVTAQGLRTRDPILLGLAKSGKDVSGKFYVTAKGAQKELTIPARAMTTVLSDFQKTYATFRDKPENIGNKFAMVLSVQKVEAAARHFGVKKERIIGLQAAQNMPKLLNLAMQSVDAKLLIEKDKAYKASLASEPRAINAANIQTGEQVILNGKAIVINSREAPSPTVKDRLMSLLKF